MSLFKSKLDPETQLLHTIGNYADNLTPGAGLESPAAADENLGFDINALRTLLRYHLTGGSGSRKWYDSPLDSFGLDAIHDKKLAADTGVRPGTSDFTLGGAASGVLVASTLLPSVSPLIAVGPSSTTNGGYIAADEANFTTAGTLGVGLSVANDAAGVTLNKARIVIASTNAPPVTVDNEEIFGLLQTVNGTGDGASVAGGGSQNLQLSFAFIDKDTDVLTATTLPADDYHFSTRRNWDFYSLPVGALVGAGFAPPEAIDPTATILKVPFREIDITGPGPGVAGPAANDPMVITTGVFTTGGAQTIAAQFGTPALPASGTDFRDDPRIKIYLNGQKLSKGANAAANRDVYWVSTTQIAFEEKLKIGNIIYIEAPDTY